ncbi:WGR domain-containing protein [Mesorhizobium tianshanense]|uniref:WGR domain-containing protein n=2 Tax=Mesorhizobium tianshanense TaxID=39844 RepID=A0A562M7Z7_9HYPH|nr:WGR domain-containing protein [Mesorhizobium tianshanense]
MRHDHHPCFLRRIDLNRNLARIYILILQPTLFGEMPLVRSGGRIGTRGREKFELFETTDEAAAAWSKLAICKAQARIFRHALARQTAITEEQGEDGGRCPQPFHAPTPKCSKALSPAKLRTASLKPLQQ